MLGLGCLLGRMHVPIKSDQSKATGKGEQKGDFYVPDEEGCLRHAAMISEISRY